MIYRIGKITLKHIVSLSKHRTHYESTLPKYTTNTYNMNVGVYSYCDSLAINQTL